MGTDNAGHGHVTPRADGMKARCGGPGLCLICSREKARLGRTIPKLKRAARSKPRRRLP